MRIWTLAAVLALAGCATPYEQCRNAVTRDLRVVTGLIAEKEAVLQRGYAIEQETHTRTRFVRCEDDDGDIELCREEESYTRNRPVAVDLEEERRILTQLRAQRAELQARAAADLRACRARYPEG
jgi:hypothetical protein